MDVLLTGVKVPSISIEREEDNATPSSGYKATGKYKLMSSKGTVLAVQSFNGYESLKVTFSLDTQRLLRDVVESVERDINEILGFGGKEP